jgi:hypothetical protein
LDNFAIIQQQQLKEKEISSQRMKKPLSCIQVEEKAISELWRQYSEAKSDFLNGERISIRLVKESSEQLL